MILHILLLQFLILGVKSQIHIKSRELNINLSNKNSQRICLRMDSLFNTDKSVLQYFSSEIGSLRSMPGNPINLAHKNDKKRSGIYISNPMGEKLNIILYKNSTLSVASLQNPFEDDIISESSVDLLEDIQDLNCTGIEAKAFIGIFLLSCVKEPEKFLRIFIFFVQDISKYSYHDVEEWNSVINSQKDSAIPVTRIITHPNPKSSSSSSSSKTDKEFLILLFDFNSLLRSELKCIFMEVIIREEDGGEVEVNQSNLKIHFVPFIDLIYQVSSIEDKIFISGKSSSNNVTTNLFNNKKNLKNLKSGNNITMLVLNISENGFIDFTNILYKKIIKNSYFVAIDENNRLLKIVENETNHQLLSSSIESIVIIDQSLKLIEISSFILNLEFLTSLLSHSIIKFWGSPHALLFSAIPDEAYSRYLYVSAVHPKMLLDSSKLGNRRFGFWTSRNTTTLFHDTFIININDSYGIQVFSNLPPFVEISNINQISKYSTITGTDSFTSLNVNVNFTVLENIFDFTEILDPGKLKIYANSVRKFDLPRKNIKGNASSYKINFFDKKYKILDFTKASLSSTMNIKIKVDHILENLSFSLFAGRIYIQYSQTGILMIHICDYDEEVLEIYCGSGQKWNFGNSFDLMPKTTLVKKTNYFYYMVGKQLEGSTELIRIQLGLDGKLSLRRTMIKGSCRHFEILSLDAGNVLLICLIYYQMEVYKPFKNDWNFTSILEPLQVINSSKLMIDEFCPVSINVKNPSLGEFEVLSICLLGNGTRYSGNGQEIPHPSAKKSSKSQAEIIRFYYNKFVTPLTYFPISKKTPILTLCGTTNQIVLTDSSKVLTYDYDYLSKLEIPHEYLSKNGTIRQIFCGNEGNIIVILFAKKSEDHILRYDMIVINGDNPYQQGNQIMDIRRDIMVDILHGVNIVKMGHLDIVQYNDYKEAQYLAYSRKKVTLKIETGSIPSKYLLPNKNIDTLGKKGETSINKNQNLDGKYQLKMYTNTSIRQIRENDFYLQKFNPKIEYKYPQFERNALKGSYFIRDLIILKSPISLIKLNNKKGKNSVKLSDFEEKISLRNLDPYSLVKIKNGIKVASSYNKSEIVIIQDDIDQNEIKRVKFSDGSQKLIDFDFTVEWNKNEGFLGDFEIFISVVYKFNLYQCQIGLLNFYFSKINPEKYNKFIEITINIPESKKECYDQISLVVPIDGVIITFLGLDSYQRGIDFYEMDFKNDQQKNETIDLEVSNSISGVDNFDVVFLNSEFNLIHTSNNLIYRTKISNFNDMSSQLMPCLRNSTILQIACEPSEGLCVVETISDYLYVFSLLDSKVALILEKVFPYLSGVSGEGLTITSQIVAFIARDDSFYNTINPDSTFRRLFFYNIEPNVRSLLYKSNVTVLSIYSINLYDKLNYLGSSEIENTIQGQGTETWVSYSNNGSRVSRIVNNQELRLFQNFEIGFQKMTIDLYGRFSQESIPLSDIFVNGPDIGKNYIGINIGMFMLLGGCVLGWMIVCCLAYLRSKIVFRGVKFWRRVERKESYYSEVMGEGEGEGEEVTNLEMEPSIVDISQQDFGESTFRFKGDTTIGGSDSFGPNQLKL